MASIVIDTVMTGHASAADLAAMGLGASVYSSVFMGLVGVVSALNPIVAHHHGGRRWEAIGASYVQGLWLALLLSLVGIPLLAFPGPWLARLGAPPDVEALVTDYLRLHTLALPAALMFRATYAFNVAISRPKVMMAVQVFGLVLKVALNYALIFGHFGLPRLGAVGCGLASLIAHWALFLMGWAYIASRPDVPSLRDRAGAAAVGRAPGAPPSGGADRALVCPRVHVLHVHGAADRAARHQRTGGAPDHLEPGGARLPDPARAVAGDRDPDRPGARGRGPGQARRTAFTGIRVAVSAASLTAISFWALRRWIVGLYTDDGAVTAVALSLIGYLVAFHVFDALQAIAAFVLRAYRVVVVPTVIYAVALWGLGVGGGYLVGFHAVLGGPRGASGVWMMQSVALFLTSLLLFALLPLGAPSPARCHRVPRADP